MCLRNREPRLEDILADSIVRAVMEADCVDPLELETELRRTAALLRATRRTPGFAPINAYSRRPRRCGAWGGMRTVQDQIR
jgi:hypothetical protein